MIKLMALLLVLFFPPTDLILVDNNSAWIKKATKQTEKHFKQKTQLHRFSSEQLSNSINSSFYRIKNEQNDELGLAVIIHAKGCVIGGCSIDNKNDTRFEQFHLLSLYNKEKELIKLSVLNYPGQYGYEISAKWWLKQFIGKSSKKYNFRQNIDAISGATVSAQSVVDEINSINLIVEKLNY